MFIYCLKNNISSDFITRVRNSYFFPPRNLCQNRRIIEDAAISNFRNFLKINNCIRDINFYRSVGETVGYQRSVRKREEWGGEPRTGRIEFPRVLFPSWEQRSGEVKLKYWISALFTSATSDLKIGNTGSLQVSVLLPRDSPLPPPLILLSFSLISASPPLPSLV